VLLSLFNEGVPSEPFFNSLESERLVDRLKALNRKPLDSLDPSRNPLIRIGMDVDAAGEVTWNGYGVFDLAWQIGQHPKWAKAIQREIAEIGERLRPRFLIWAGMGGSAEDKHMYNGVGLLAHGPRCYVLDSTDPAKMQSILDDITKRSRGQLKAALASTLVVGMAMGMTSYEPVLNLEKLVRLYDLQGVDPRPSFLYLTIDGSVLDKFASNRRFRRVPLQPDGRGTTAGRHSGPLTRGSLYPLALAGTDLAAWMEQTELAPAQVLTAWKLAAFLHAQGTKGRDKVTLMLPKEWSAAGVWTKQDFEESLGKSEQIGIKIVLEDRIKLPNYRSPKDKRQDRVFVAIQCKDFEPPDARKIAQIRRSGYPVAVLTLPRGSQLSRYMQLMHYVVFGLAWLRQMNFTTQPSVELYKSIAARLFAAAGKAGSIEKTAAWRDMRGSANQAKWRSGITLYFDRMARPDPCPRSAAEIYATLLGGLAGTRAVEYGELTFFGDTRYSAPGRALRTRLNRAAETLFRGRLKMPVDVYEGPAMNHSYHEMIIGHGKCFSTVLISEASLKIASIGYTADYHRAQFLATIAALAERGRPVVAIVLADLGDKTLAALDEFFRQAAKHVNL
jgi:glucose-6-phosphate isomerase